jgi:hypothetical protein
MALRKTSPRYIPTRVPRGHVPRLPHSSWRLAPAGADELITGGGVNATEFWTRLGL